MQTSKERLRPQRRKVRRHPTIYDACAGRVSGRGRLVRDDRTKPNVRTGKEVRLPPDEALFRRYPAPDSLDRRTIYPSDALDLPPGLIPDAELLRAIHLYAAQLFAGLGARSADRCWGAFDGTALLAVGALVEEAVREMVGESGERAFVGGIKRMPGESRERVEERLDVETILRPRGRAKGQGGNWEEGIFVVPD